MYTHEDNDLLRHKKSGSPRQREVTWLHKLSRTGVSKAGRGRGYMIPAISEYPNRRGGDVATYTFFFCPFLNVLASLKAI